MSTTILICSSSAFRSHHDHEEIPSSTDSEYHHCASEEWKLHVRVFWCADDLVTDRRRSTVTTIPRTLRKGGTTSRRLQCLSVVSRKASPQRTQRKFTPGAIRIN